MKKSLLATAAAVALLAGPGLASAQKNEAPTPAPAQQQNAPAEKIAPAVKGAPAKGAETNMPQAKPQTTGQAEPKMEPKGDKAKAEQLPAKNGAKNAQTPASPAAKNGASDKADVKASDSKSDAKPSAAQVPAQQNQQTTGKAAAPANLSAEQRTKISAAVKQQNVPRATNVNFSISIGTHVPRSLRLYALPASVVEFYPAWRGYEFILVGNEILVIDPRTLEIVAILAA
jgi:hypothetical protein